MWSLFLKHSSKQALFYVYHLSKSSECTNWNEFFLKMIDERLRHYKVIHGIMFIRIFSFAQIINLKG